MSRKDNELTPLVCQIPNKLKRELRIAAAKQEKNMTEFIVDLLENTIVSESLKS